MISIHASLPWVQYRLYEDNASYENIDEYAALYDFVVVDDIAIAVGQHGSIKIRKDILAITKDLKDRGINYVVMRRPHNKSFPFAKPIDCMPFEGFQYMHVNDWPGVKDDTLATSRVTSNKSMEPAETDD